MKLAHRLALPAFLLLPVSLLAQNPPPAAPKEAAKPAAPAAAAPAPAATGLEVKLALAIENKDPKDPAASFKVADGTKIYAWTRVTGESGEVTIAFRKGDNDVWMQKLAVPSVPYRTNAYRTFRKGDAGDWMAVVRDAAGKGLGSAPFKVEIE
ncbi:MAG: DUF2914 domain-containing protein [Thermoanaerobaculia bacterium]